MSFVGSEYGGAGSKRRNWKDGVRAMLVIEEEQFLERVNVFEEFLDIQTCSVDGIRYKERILSMLRHGDRHLVVLINDVRAFNTDYFGGLLSSPSEYLPAFDKALQNMAELLYEPEMPYLNISKVFFHIGFDGVFGEYRIGIRELGSMFLSKMVCVDGIVTSCFSVRPKLTKSVHYAEERDIFITKSYYDSLTTTNHMPSSNTYPTEDSEGNKLSTEYGYCLYQDCQQVLIQEMPEKAPTGQLPRGVDVILLDGLVDRLKPGDRVRVVGVYKASIGTTTQNVSTKFNTVILANNVKLLGREENLPLLTDIDIQNIKEISMRPDVFDLLSRSFATSICGHKIVKKAIVLMLLGGVEKTLESLHIRGDINLLLVGDPSTAKSQLLRFVLGIAPLAIATTGKGASGVGLTAAVVQDKETGDKRLEAGAMVLADRGIVCIDEFDKMNDIDRIAIHEAMEQQTVTISKAGIHLSLNARCSVIAAANPIWNQYKETKTPQENIRLSDALLSRFDLLFIILDTIDEERDRIISKHITNIHRYEECEGPVEEKAETSVFQNATGIKYYTLEGEQTGEYLSVSFLKKYIHYAKIKFKPILTQEAIELIKICYGDFRLPEDPEATREKTHRVTPRTLETLIRLATAHAKARLSYKVEVVDVKAAAELVSFCLYKDVNRRKVDRKKKARQSEPQSTIESEVDRLDLEGTVGEIDDDDDFVFSEAVQSPKFRTLGTASQLEEDVESQTSAQETSGSIPQSSQGLLDEDLEVQVKKSLQKLRTLRRGESFLQVSDLLDDLNPGREQTCTIETVELVLQKMEDENLLMYRDRLIIFL